MVIEIDEEERAENIRVIKDPDKWPCWPILPMKKVVSKTEMPTSGFMLATGESVVYLKNMFDIKGGTVKDIMESTPSKRYESLNAMIDDGWLVD